MAAAVPLHPLTPAALPGSGGKGFALVPFSRGLKTPEVAATSGVVGVAHEPKVGFVNQSCSLQGLARLFLSEFLGREFAQFIVYQRQELLRGARIAGFDGGQDAGDVAHSPPE